jgi:hypothetical protein
MFSVGVEAQPSYRGTTGQVAPSRDALNLDYEKRAKALQRELTTLKQADRGVLTEAHLALIQTKLEDLLSSYESDLHRIDPMSVNADGSQPH